MTTGSLGGGGTDDADGGSDVEVGSEDRSTRSPNWVARAEFLKEAARIAESAGKRATRVSVLPAAFAQLVGLGMISAAVFLQFDSPDIQRETDAGQGMYYGPSFETSEFIALLIVGAILLIAGPLVITVSSLKAQKEAGRATETAAAQQFDVIDSSLSGAPSIEGRADAP